MARLLTDEQYAEHQARLARYRLQKQGATAETVNTQAAPAPAIAEPPALPRDRAGAAPSKFRNVKTNGYASKKEAKRAMALKLMAEAGQIRNLREQVSYLLIPKQEGERATSYVADFVYEAWPAWETVVEDAKGFRTDIYRIKRKLMLMVHGIRIVEV